MDGWPWLDSVADSVIIVFGGMEIKYGHPFHSGSSLIPLSSSAELAGSLGFGHLTLTWHFVVHLLLR